MERMFSRIEQVRNDLAQFAAEYEPDTFDGAGAVRVMSELAIMQRLLDGLIARTAKRVDDTHAHARTADRSGAALAARLIGTETSRMNAAVATASALETLPGVDRALRAGKLSLREAELITNAATINPGAEHELLSAAGQGLPKLKTACLHARARAENPHERRERLHAARSWHSYVGLPRVLWSRVIGFLCCS